MSRILDRMPLEKRISGKSPVARSAAPKAHKESAFISDAATEITTNLNEQALSPQAMLRLQQTHGNQYVQRLIQRKRQDDHAAKWHRQDSNLLTLDPSAPVEIENTGGDNAAPELNSAETSTVQRLWTDVPLEYTQIRGDKKLSQIRTGKVKFNSIEDWVDKFHKALNRSKSAEVLKALKGLLSRLTSDAEDARKGNLKPPKGISKKDFDKPAAQLAAGIFFQKWIQATQDHLDYSNSNTSWLNDFRRFYVGNTTTTLDLDEESLEEGSSGGKTEKEEKKEKKVAVLDPRASFLNNVAQLEDIKDEELEGMAYLWDTGDQTMRQRLSAVMGNDPELKRVNRVPYFLEAVSPVHVGYETVRNMFQFWTTAVLHYGWTKSYAEWMTQKLESGDTTLGKVTIVPYFGDDKRGEFKLTFNGGQVLKADSKPLVGDSIYVVGGDNVFYGGSSDGGVHHTSFLEGMPVKCAGHMTTDSSGNLQSINDNSGHYEPNKENLKRCVAALKDQMDTSKVIVGSYSGKGGMSVDDFLKS